MTEIEIEFNCDARHQESTGFVSTIVVSRLGNSNVRLRLDRATSLSRTIAVAKIAGSRADRLG